MTTVSLSQLLEGINQQVDSHENLDTHLRQVDALVRISTASNFDEIHNETIHHYLSVLMDIMEKALQLSDHLSQDLCQLASQLRQEIK